MMDSHASTRIPSMGNRVHCNCKGREIYVASQRTNCGEALRIATRARGNTGLEVAVIDRERAEQSAPPCVFAVPTYLLDDRIVSLGNPAREEFLAGLRRRIEEKAK